MTMTKKEAIKYHIDNMHDIDLIHLVREIYDYNGSYDEYVFYSMGEFDEVYEGYAPTEIAEEFAYARSDFNIADDYFYYDYDSCLCSCNERTAADLIRTDCTNDLVNDFMHMRNCEPVADCDNALWDIITADGDATFNDEGYEILEQEV